MNQHSYANLAIRATPSRIRKRERTNDTGLTDTYTMASVQHSLRAEEDYTGPETVSEKFFARGFFIFIAKERRKTRWGMVSTSRSPVT
eukprot:scaffold34621_cov166-Amphora_coffeaeformis.AAC.6